VVNRAIGAPRGEPAYTLIHEVFFADLAAATYALNTPEGRAAGADLMSFAREIATMMFAEVWGEDVTEAPAPSVEPELAPAAAAASAAVAELANATPLAPSSIEEKPYTIEDIIAMNTPEVVSEEAPAEANIGAAAMAEEAIAEEVVAKEAIAEQAIALEPALPSRPSLGESLLP
jgi:hypothetical protein